MTTETYCKIEITKVTKGVKDQTVYERIYDEKHPKVLANPELSQYGYVTVCKSFSEEEEEEEEEEMILEEKLEAIDLNKILRAVNKEL